MALWEANLNTPQQIQQPSYAENTRPKAYRPNESAKEAIYGNENGQGMGNGKTRVSRRN